MPIDITAIPQLARNLNRVAEMAGVLAKYGLADWLDRLDAKFLKRWVKDTQLDTLSDTTHEARIRLAFTELGTTFIKLGQMLSTRRDLVGPALANELTKLQANVPADDFATVKGIIEAELQKPLQELFAEFSEAPLASASVGQAHRAKLHDGRQVIVKVQHPNITAKIEQDLSILAEIASIAEEYLSDVRAYRPTALMVEFRKSLMRELDFRREARHLQIFRKNFANDPDVVFPEPFTDFSSSRVLTMTFLPGTNLSLASGLLPPTECSELARRGANVFLDMIFRDGFYHADPHPGNVLRLADGRLGLLDGGMVGRVDDKLRGQIERAMVAVLANDAASLTDLVMQVGEVPPHFEPSALQSEIADQLAFYFGMPLDQFNLGNALDELTEAIRRFQIVLPPSLSMLLKVLVMLEGTARLLSPTFNLVEVMEPYRKQFIRRRFSTRAMLGRVLTTLSDWDEVFQAMPRLTRDLMTFARRQQFAVQLQHQHLEPSVNRLVFGLLTSSLFLGSAMLWAFRAPPTVFDISIVGLAGCAASAIFGIRLFFAIQKSGKLEDDK
ncbi:MAG: ABC1 kinase family protein [Fimbriiglobus sp.]